MEKTSVSNVKVFRLLVHKLKNFANLAFRDFKKQLKNKYYGFKK